VFSVARCADLPPASSSGSLAMFAAMRHASSRVIEVGVGQRLPLAVADDEAGVRLLDGLGRREAACLHH
jgi:hypothetical protein